MTINTTLIETDKTAILSLINKKIKPIINFLYFYNFEKEKSSKDNTNLIKDFEYYSNESIIYKILSRNDVILNIKDNFYNFKIEIMKYISDSSSFNDLNKFIKNSETLFYKYKLNFNNIISNKCVNIAFNNDLELNFMKCFEQFESSLNLISEFCDLTYSYELKKDKITKIIEITDKLEDLHGVKEILLNLERSQHETVLFVIKNTIHLYLSNMDAKTLDVLKPLLNEKISSLNKILSLEKDFMGKIKSKYPKLLILEDADIIKFFWLILNPVKSNFDLINTYYYKLTNSKYIYINISLFEF